MKKIDSHFFITSLTSAATQHGIDSEPDHEVGDLQEHLKKMWDMLTDEQRLAFMKDDATLEIIENGDSHILGSVKRRIKTLERGGE